LYANYSHLLIHELSDEADHAVADHLVVTAVGAVELIDYTFKD
jgi:hypothetical protein